MIKLSNIHFKVECNSTRSTGLYIFITAFLNIIWNAAPLCNITKNKMVLLKYQTMNIACMENKSVFLVVLECNVLVKSEFTSPSNDFFWWRAFFLFTHNIVSNFYLNNSFSFRNGYNLFASRPLMESFKTKTWFFLWRFVALLHPGLPYKLTNEPAFSSIFIFCR